MTTAASAPHLWHDQDTAQVLASLGSSPDGLTTAESASRLADNGPNVLAAGPRVHPLRILAAQFSGLIIWILIGAGALSLALGERVDAAAIAAIVLLNAAIGFYQEFSAERSIAALQELTAPRATVRRDGATIVVAAMDIVVGDVLHLEAGDLIAADARLLSVSSLTCVEAALTGESAPTTKQAETLPDATLGIGDRDNMVFLGTSVAAGAGEAVVVSVAMETELGRIAGLLQSAGADRDTPFQQKLNAFARVLVWGALGVVVLLLLLGVMRGTPWLELVMTSVSLAVAAVPEGLPAVVTVSLSLGAMRMARQRALVRKLAAVETLGSTSVICTDKTGTLTVGEMTVRELRVSGEQFSVTGEGYGPAGAVERHDAIATASAASTEQSEPLRELLTILVGCNSARLAEVDGVWSTVGDPTEGALLAAGVKAGVTRAALDEAMPERRVHPFDSERKRSSSIRAHGNDGCRALVKGAPGVLLERCTHIRAADGVRPITAHDHKHVLAQVAKMASSALRVLAGAYRDVSESMADALSADEIERELVFVGLVGMYDPPRAEAKAAIATCHRAGIRVVMITGDHAETAAAIARELGVKTHGDPVSGTQLDALTDDALRATVLTTSVFARVSAEHKLRIVRALKGSDAVVAMTGDGVNDAPALKGADIGIAMGRAGTEVTKQAADMIITDDNFATIVLAVEEGRGIYDNIRKTLQYLLAGNTGELTLMLACVLIGMPAPLLPIHLLWINLVTDGIPAFCLATDAIDDDVMSRAPRRRAERITSGRFVPTMVITGMLTAGVALTVFIVALQRGDLAYARSAAFAVLVFGELLRAFGARSAQKPLWRIRPLINPALLAVVVLSIGVQFLSQHSVSFGRVLKTTPLPFSDGALLLALGAIPLVLLEVLKLVWPYRSSSSSSSSPPASAVAAAAPPSPPPTKAIAEPLR